MDTGAWQRNCAPWEASADGAYVSSGVNSAIASRYNAAHLFSTLRISATFVRAGTITYQYKVQAERMVHGLIFEVDYTPVVPLKSQVDDWTEVTVDVAPGAHTFSWEYTKDISGDYGDDRAAIKVIELVGTSFSDTVCHPCGGDLTMNGGSLCGFCGANEFAAPISASELDFTCYQCPEGTTSPRGSIGAAACVVRRACTKDDLVENFSECFAGKRTVSYEWSTPATCDPDQPGSIALPPLQVDAACDRCPAGFMRTPCKRTASLSLARVMSLMLLLLLLLLLVHLCATCLPGQMLNASAVEGGATELQDACVACGAGQVVMRELTFGNATQDGWSMWPSIVDQAAAKSAGWKLTKEAVVLVPPVSQNGQLTHAKAFPLAFNVTFTTSGVFHLTYELGNLPTFAADGARAWLDRGSRTRARRAWCAHRRPGRPRGAAPPRSDHAA